MIGVVELIYRVYPIIIGRFENPKCLAKISKYPQSGPMVSLSLLSAIPCYIRTLSSSKTQGSQRELPRLSPPRMGFETLNPESPSLRYSALDNAMDSRRHPGTLAKLSSMTLPMLG